MRLKVGLCAILLVLTSALVGCGGGSSNNGGGGGGNTPTLTAIVVSGGGTVNIGGTLQLTATGQFSDGSSRVLTSGVTWQSSNSSIAAVDGNGLATGAGHGSAQISATSGGMSDDDTVTVNPFVAITVTPIGPGILVGQQQAFTAVGAFADGTTLDATAMATWQSSDTTKASFSGNTATGAGVGVVTVKATADGVIGNTALNVVATPYAQLNGSYAFNIVSADTRGPAYYYGSFTVDGAGAITGGIEDANTAAGVVTSEPLSGTYFEYPDGRGEIFFSSNAIHPTGLTLRFGLAANGSVGKLIQFDGHGTAKGSFEAQSSTSVFGSLGANMVFRTAGVDDGNNSLGAPAPMGQVGVFSIDGVGNLTSGSVDTNDYGTITAQVPLSPSTYTTPDEHGRGTIQFITASSTTNYAFYTVNAGKMFFIQTDAAPATAVAGVVELQNIPSGLTVHNLFGGYAFLVGRPVVVSTNGFDRTEFAQVGEYTFDGTGGAGSVTGVRDDANNSVPNPLVDFTGDYSVGLSGINGRGTFDAHSVAQGTDRNYIFHTVSVNGSSKIARAYLLQTTNFGGGSFNAATGEMDLQTAINISSLTGVFQLDASELTGSYSEALMQLTLDGVSKVTGIADVSDQVNGGGLSITSSQVTSATYGNANPPSQPSAGRAALTLPNQIGFQNSVFYIISPQSAYILGATPNTPAADGGLLKQ